MGQSEALLAAVNSKLEDGNIKAAVRILCEGGQPATPTEQNLKLLQDKHPQDPCPEALEDLPDPASTVAWQASVGEVLEAVRSFPVGSAGGPDGFRPGHLLDLVGRSEPMLPLVEALTDFVNLLLRGECPPEVRQILFGGNMIALNKNTGGLRPIAVGYVWRRLAAKCANRYAVARLSSHFAPLQLGIGVPGGCEAAVHAARRFVKGMHRNQVLVKLDFTNAFNTLRRDVMLGSVYQTIPEIYSFAHQAYSTPSVLAFGHLSLSSQMGPQQGDPLGPLLFSLPLQPTLCSLGSSLKIGFLDDLTLGGDLDTVTGDVLTVAGLGPSMGLQLNPGKCEVFLPDATVALPPLLADYTRVEPDMLSLLGAPLFTGGALDGALAVHCDTFQRALVRLRQLPSQNALILLRSSFGASKLSYILRCSPCSDHPALGTLDGLMRTGLESIVNCTLNDIQWLQAALPIRDGGLGLRRVASLASSAYLASAASTLELQAAILATCAAMPDQFMTDLLSARRDTLPITMCPLPVRQSAWDRPLIEKDKAEIDLAAVGLVDRARLAAISSPHSADWMMALPVAVCGLALDNEAVRVAVGLRLGLALCASHKCQCGDWVGPEGHHGFVCRKASGRSLRHHAINDIIWRALLKADVPSTKEPAGLFRSDGKRPDGATLIPWIGGKYLTWDATVVHTCAASYIGVGSVGPASEQAANRKIQKYQGLPASHLFQPVAIETLGSFNQSALEFLSELGRRLSVIVGDRRETAFLFQRLSVCIQRFNLVAFKGTFPTNPEDEA